jgi:hypothetical protein
VWSASAYVTCNKILILNGLTNSWYKQCVHHHHHQQQQQQQQQHYSPWWAVASLSHELLKHKHNLSLSVSMPGQSI